MEDAVAARTIEDDSAAIGLGSAKARMRKTQGEVVDIPIPSLSGVTPTVDDKLYVFFTVAEIDNYRFY